MTESSTTRSQRQDAAERSARYEQGIEFLFGRINYERRPDLANGPQSFRLGRMQSLLHRIGNPQNDLSCVHIAGSKGKGSTATMVAQILETAGLKIGLFTSPHAHRFEERFTVNGLLPSEEDVNSILDQLQRVTVEMDAEASGGPTFFELATAAGWLYFKKQQVDLAVIEVGLGGRLDSTNVCHPLVSIISSISKDHTRLLGETEALIAREKAGIIKHQIPVISGVLHPEAAAVIHEVADSQNSPIQQLGRELKISAAPPDRNSELILPGWSFDFEHGETSFKDLQLSMPGEHQTRNAALAVAAVMSLKSQGIHVSESHLREGLLSARIPLRVELINRKPILIIDAAHNPASIQALCETLEPVPARKKICLFASSRDKDCAELLRVLDHLFDEFILTAYQENPRAIPIEDLEVIAQRILTTPFTTSPNPTSTLQQALTSASSQDLICATGSFFLAAEIGKAWKLADHS